MIKPNYYVITGGPGVGKTSLINELQVKGYIIVPEVAREIIRYQIEINGEVLPWKNKVLYSKLMLEKSISDYLESQQIHETVFFDRGIPDTLAYNKLIRLSIDKDIYETAISYRYNNRIFLLPPWKEIYHTDTERKQDYREAVATYEMMKLVYSELGYEILEIPKLPVEKRANFVIQTIK